MAKVLPVTPKKPPPKKAPAKEDTGKGPSNAKKDTGKKGGDKKDSKKPKSGEQLQKDAEKRAKADQKTRDTAAGKRYLAQASNLEAQAKAIKDALDVEFARSRDNNLGDIDKVLGQNLTLLKEGHSLRSVGFRQAAQDNDIAAGGLQEAGFNNLVRERQDSMSAILEQGAGETDAMRAMVMSARNFGANMSEANRNFYDTRTSINTGIVDLNLDTKTALANTSTTAESEKEKVWQDFYNSRAEGFTQLGNVRGQQSDFYAQAKELGVGAGKTAKGNDRATVRKNETEKAFADAANERGKSYTNAGLPDWIRDFTGMESVKTEQSNSNLAAAVQFEPLGKAEGATLRKWEAA